MTDPRTRALELRAEAEALPSARIEQVERLELAARFAEEANDLELTFSIRYRLVDAALSAGEIHRSLVAFSWCLAQCDRAPERFPEHQMLWRYKWMLEWAASFVEVPRPQVEALLTDVAKRFERAGAGKNAVAKLQMRGAMLLGEREEAARAYERWRTTPRDYLSDCLACDEDERVWFLLEQGREDEGLEAAVPLLLGKRTCGEVPHVTFGRVLLPFLRRGRLEAANTYQRRGYRMLKTLPKKLVGHVSSHLAYLSLVGAHGRALRILVETLPLAASHSVGMTRMEYLQGAWILFACMEKYGVSEVTLALPESLGGDGKLATQHPKGLAAQVLAAASALEERFDARNGNRGVSISMQKFRDEIALSREPIDSETPSEG